MDRMKSGRQKSLTDLREPAKFVDDAGGYDHHRWGYYGSIDARHDDVVHERVAHHFPKTKDAMQFLHSRRGRHMADGIHHLESGHKDVAAHVDKHIGWYKKEIGHKS